jgi:hypothetical protein
LNHSFGLRFSLFTALLVQLAAVLADRLPHQSESFAAIVLELITRGADVTLRNEHQESVLALIKRSELLMDNVALKNVRSAIFFLSCHHEVL